MTSKTRIRKWVNRDDGGFYQAGNRDLRWHEVVGNLLFVFALGLYLIPVIADMGVRNFAVWPLLAALLILTRGAIAGDSGNTNADP